MKKLLLSLAVVATGFWAQSQVAVVGISPANIAGNYTFTWADPAGGDWACPDFLVPGTFIQGDLVLVEDGTPGTNLQGNPISQEGCNPLINGAAVAGNIAVVYRNTCEFGMKALNAQNAGAIGVIILNRDDEAIGMGGGAEGLNVTIPVVMLSSSDGLSLTQEMLNGPVNMLIGNKVGAFPNDVGANDGEMLVSPYGGANSAQFDGFDLGIQVYNFGSNVQSNFTINAQIVGPSGVVYDETVIAPTMNTGDTLSIFNGNPEEFPPFNLGGIGSYPDGLYTLTYSLIMDAGATSDDSDFDNILSSTFTVQGNTLGLSNTDLAGLPIANSYPSNSTTEYQSCMMIQEPNASLIGTQGMYFIPHTDTSVNELAGAEIFINAYQWDDAWVDLDDPAYVGGALNDWFQNLNLITFATHYPASNDDVDDVAYAAWTTPFVLQDNVRYLFCLQTFESATISFGYDSGINYDGNQGIFRQPTSPVHVDGSWYTGGWSGVSAPSMALRTFDPAELGLESTEMLKGTAYPNPANDVVTISVPAEGAATLTVTDIAGKVAFNNAVTLVNGSTQVNIASLEAGVYIFNVTLENGQTSQFNVVKK